MPTKTITTSVTLHLKDEKRSKPFVYGALGDLISGKHVVIEVAPGTAVSFEAVEADRILARHGGEEVDYPAKYVVAPKVDDIEEDAPVVVSGKPAK